MGRFGRDNQKVDGMILIDITITKHLYLLYALAFYRFRVHLVEQTIRYKALDGPALQVGPFFRLTMYQ